LRFTTSATAKNGDFPAPGGHPSSAVRSFSHPQRTAVCGRHRGLTIKIFASKNIDHLFAIFNYFSEYP
jgi:hypothetical protein